METVDFVSAQFIESDGTIRWLTRDGQLHRAVEDGPAIIYPEDSGLAPQFWVNGERQAPWAATV